MRKVVTPFVFLSLFLAFWSCENQPLPKNKAVTKQTKPAKKRKKPILSDTILAQDTLQLDTLIGATGPVNTDSLADAYSENESEEWDKPDSTLAVAKIDSVKYMQFPDTLAASDMDTDEEPPDEIIEDPYIDQGHIPESGLNLEKERLVKTEILKVYRPDYTNTYDSTLSVIEKRISIQPEEVSQKMVVERWISPVNYRGYKFNRKKLMLYGIGKNDMVHIFYYLDGYYFSLADHIYFLKETNNNTAFIVVKDSILENHLLEYEDQL